MSDYKNEARKLKHLDDICNMGDALVTLTGLVCVEGYLRYGGEKAEKKAFSKLKSIKEKITEIEENPEVNRVLKAYHINLNADDLHTYYDAIRTGNCSHELAIELHKYLQKILKAM